jgi:hypothetical protein
MKNANVKSDENRDTNFLYGAFESFHPAGICQFLIGDGSVRAFSVTTPIRTLACLGTVNDGNVVQLP